jgi:hypothetical protein
MAEKLENGVFPGWGKSKKDDVEFERDLDDLEIEKSKYVKLRDEYIQKIIQIESTKKELAEIETEGKLSIQDCELLADTIKSMEKDLVEMKSQILPLAERLSKLVADPRYSDLRFLDKHDDGTVDDEEDDYIDGIA